MNWKNPTQWQLHFEMTLTEIPGDPERVMSEVVTRDPIS